MASPWDRQDGETPKAWAAFAVYRDLGPTARSIRTVARTMNRSASYLGVWSSKYGWPERAEAWDKFVDAQVRDRQDTARDLMIDRQAELGMHLAAIADHQIREVLDAITHASEPGISRRARTLRLKKIPKLTPYAMAHLAKSGTAIERVARGLHSGDETEIHVRLSLGDAIRRMRARSEARARELARKAAEE